MITASHLPLVKLPDKLQESLYLIGEELKSRRLFHGLRQAGFDDCYFQPQLDALILKHLGLPDPTDEQFTRYNEVLEKRSKKIEAGEESIVKQAMKVYVELKGIIP